MYEVGDIAVVRKRNIHGGYTHDLFWNPRMDEYVGKTFIVKEKINKRRVTLWGAAKKEGGFWIFDEDWLDPTYDENEELDCGDFTALISNI